MPAKKMAAKKPVKKEEKKPVKGKQSMKKASSMAKGGKKSQAQEESEGEPEEPQTPSRRSSGGKKGRGSRGSKKPMKSPKKSPKKVTPAKKKTSANNIKKIEEALEDGYGVVTHEIIKLLVRPCLETPADERIPIQNNGIAMIAQHLQTVRHHLHQECNAKQAYLDSTATIEATLNSKQDQLNHRKELLDEQKASVVVKEEQEVAALSDAQKALKEATATKKQVTDEGPLMEKNFKTVQEMQGNQYRVLSEDPPTNAKECKKLTKVVTDVCRDVLHMEATIVDTLPNVLATQPNLRAGFATLALNEAEKAMRFWMSEIQMRIANHGSNVAHAEQNLATANAEKERCEGELAQTRAVLDQVNAQIEQNKSDIKANNAALKQHPKDVDAGNKELAHAQSRHQDWENVTELYQLLKMEETEKPSEEDEEDKWNGGGHEVEDVPMSSDQVEESPEEEYEE